MSLSASPSLLLVLAWDDADLPGQPEGEPPRPAALPLLRALAARQPLLALLPHLPDGARATSGAELPEPAAAGSLGSNPSGAKPALPPFVERSAAAPAAAPVPAAGLVTSGLEAEKKNDSPPTPVPAAPGEVLLTTAAITSGPAGTAGYQSRLLGVAEALPAVLSTEQSALANAEIIAAAPDAKSLTPTVSLRLSLSQQAPPMPMHEPAAPYQGRSEASSFRPVPPGAALPLPAASLPAPASTIPAVGPALVPLRVALPPTGPAAEELAEEFTVLGFEPDPELPVYSGAENAFVPDETGPAEAALGAAPEPEFSPELDLDEADETITASTPPLPAAPARASMAQGLAALGPAPPAGTIPFALADDLHYRIIQFARFAGPLVEAQGQKFGVIYAADWPTWLAALELRYRLRCPLVLHLTALAANQSAPAARGWLLEMERYALRRSQLVLVPTQEVRAQVLAHYPLAARVSIVATDDTEGIVKAMADLALTS